MSDCVLNVAGISKRFGGLQALTDVGMHIERGQVYGLIGPNGAGKTTFFNVITGLYAPDSGSFELAGKPYEPKDVHLVGTTIELTLAGAKAPITNCAGSSLHNTMSTRSPASSVVTAFTRVPRTPTQVPIGSTRLS
jgi:ABC-type polysaccharide/polyol phosphate transport system ATPase subunit